MDPHSKPNKHHMHHQPSSTEVLSSAKVVAEAARQALHHETEKMDKGRVAGAAADLLQATSHYAKLEEKGMGKYLDKAEDYLYNYHSSHSTTTTTTTNNNNNNTTTTTSHSSESHSSHSDSGYGDYIKMAEGFLKKH